MNLGLASSRLVILGSVSLECQGSYLGAWERIVLISSGTGKEKWPNSCERIPSVRDWYSIGYNLHHSRKKTGL